MARGRDGRRPSMAGRAAAATGRFLLFCLTAVLVPAALILVIAGAWYFGVRPLYWWLWSGSVPHPLAYALTATAMVLLPLALFWILAGVPRLIGRLVRAARR